MPKNNKKRSSSSKRAVVVTTTQEKTGISEAKRERRKRARVARKARRAQERMLNSENVAQIESKIGVKNKALDALVSVAKGQTHHVASVIMSVAAPGAIRPMRLADSLAPERTSVLSFQQKKDITVLPPAATTPVVGKVAPVLGKGAFLVADPLYPLWVQGRPSLCGSTGQHFSMYRVMSAFSAGSQPHLTNTENTMQLDYTNLGSAKLFFGDASNPAAAAPQWLSPLGVFDSKVGWVYKPTAMMLQGFLTFTCSGKMPKGLNALISANVEYYNGEAVTQYSCSYIYQGEEFDYDGSSARICFIVSTAKNSDQPAFDFPGGNAPRNDQAGWYRTVSLTVSPAHMEADGNYVFSLVSVTLGLTTDVRSGTTLQSFGNLADSSQWPLIKPGFESGNAQFPRPYTLNEETMDASFFPLMSVDYMAQAPVLYRNCRCTAVSALFSNVTKIIDKEGTSRAVRATRANVNPWADWRSDSSFTQVNPDYARNLMLQDGLYVFVMPDARSLRFRDCVFDVTSSTGGMSGNTGANTYGSGEAPAVMDLSGFDNIMLMLFTDLGVGTNTQLQVVLDLHLEYKHNSPLWELRVTDVTPDDMAHAIKALQQMQHAFENPLHMSDILKYVQRAAGMLLPHVAPFLVDVYNKVAAPATGYSVVPYK